MPDSHVQESERDRRALVAVNDRFATEMQENGIASTAMLSLAEILATMDAIGVNPRDVVLLGTVFTTDESDKVVSEWESP